MQERSNLNPADFEGWTRLLGLKTFSHPNLVVWVNGPDAPPILNGLVSPGVGFLAHPAEAPDFVRNGLAEAADGSSADEITGTPLEPHYSRSVGEVAASRALFAAPGEKPREDLAGGAVTSGSARRASRTVSTGEAARTGSEAPVPAGSNAGTTPGASGLPAGATGSAAGAAFAPPAGTANEATK